MLKYLYNTVSGRALLKALSAPGVSRACGRFMDSRMSTVIVPAFVKKNGIDLSEYEKKKYGSFNDFFTRQIKSECRPISDESEELPAPCDGLLSAYRIGEGTVIPVKQSSYTVSQLLGGAEIADRYRNGICLVFRLCVDNYHRYCYLDSGMTEENRYIPGVLHTVRPVAMAKYPVFAQNCREYTVMDTEHFGKVTQIEVGAMLVGKIDNYRKDGPFTRGEEKGRFLYGGSTIVLLFEEDTVEISKSLFADTGKGIETPVRMGQTIGKSKHKI